MRGISPSVTLRTESDTDTRHHRGRILRLPGVYRPQADTRLLTATLGRSRVPPGARVLDYCTGTGAVALSAAETGAEDVVAVDISARAALSAWLNARLRRLPVRVRVGGLDTARAHGPFDVVLTNPPYVPAAAEEAAGTALHWNGGPDGRAVIRQVCAEARNLLVPGGFLLLVQSAVADPGSTLRDLRRSGLRADVVSRATVPFGPVMRRQADFLLTRGLIEPGQDLEDVVVIRGDRP